MKECILIKGNQDGLSIFINEDSTFEQIKENLSVKLETSRKFFGESQVVLSFEGKPLSEAEKDELVNLFSLHSDMIIACVVNEDEDLFRHMGEIKKNIEASIRDRVSIEIQEQFKSEIKRLNNDNEELNKLNQQLSETMEEMNHLALSEGDDSNSRVTFHYGTLRSGQQIIDEHSVIVMGDVNNGARVESGGNVIIIGKLKGLVHAGLNSGDEAYIVALDMNPVQLRINNTYGRAADSEGRENRKNDPKIAFVENSMIVIESIDNRVLKEIRNV